MRDYADDIHQGLTNLQIFTYIALFLLLVVRFPIADFISNFAQLRGASTHPSLMTSLGQVQDWTFYFYERWAFILTGIIIVLNRNNLQNLNIDQYFLAIFLTSGVAYAFYYFWPLGWAALLTSLFLFAFSIRHGYHIYSNINLDLWQILIVLVAGLLGILLIMSNTTFSEAAHWSIVRMPFVVIEEIVFRGLLWMFLKFLGWTVLKIIVLQAIVFWLFHIYYCLYILPFFG